MTGLGRLRMAAGIVGAAIVVVAGEAQAARTLTLTMEARGTGERTVGYDMRGPISVALESASVSFVIDSFGDSGTYFESFNAPVLTAFSFAATGLSFGSLRTTSSYFVFFEPSRVCYDNAPGIAAGPVAIDTACSTLSYRYSSPGGRGETFTGQIVSFRIDEGNTLAGGGTTRLISAIPEPSGWALLLTGFALAGYVLRRRRFCVAAA